MQRFEAYEDDNGEWRWRLWAADFELIASSGEAFASPAEALRAAAAVKVAAAGAPVERAPGLGMQAARRLRALLEGDLGGADSDSARPVLWVVNRRLPTARPPGLPIATRLTRSSPGGVARWTTTRG